MFTAGFAGDHAIRAVFSMIGGRPMIFGIMVDMDQKVCVRLRIFSYFSAMLGLTVDTYVALVVVLAVAWFCRFAGYDDFALCSLRRRQARGVFTGAIAATVPAACFASWTFLGPCA